MDNGCPWENRKSHLSAALGGSTKALTAAQSYCQPSKVQGGLTYRTYVAGVDSCKHGLELK
eukprot:839-Heterococcus_DN1.PRE.3